MVDSSEIDKLRKIIDEVDVSLLSLMNKRADLAKQIGLVKKIKLSLGSYTDLIVRLWLSGDS